MDLLSAVYNHVVLPPRLPDGQGPRIEAVSHDVLSRMARACKVLDELVDSPWSKVFQSLSVSLNMCAALNLGRLEKSAMVEHFQQLQPDHILILHVVEQNAALLVRREDWSVIARPRYHVKPRSTLIDETRTAMTSNMLSSKLSKRQPPPKGSLPQFMPCNGTFQAAPPKYPLLISPMWDSSRVGKVVILQ
ncbi:hypothetical protein GGR58DRAFT_493547 [Xylaria digitata]|nr:hypothetical protein GGR58DRAFT_493547 [Xylaria digitata]